jgi:hypothetical protein
MYFDMVFFNAQSLNENAEEVSKLDLTGSSLVIHIHPAIAF